MIDVDSSHESSVGANSVSNISRRDLKGVIGDSSHLESSAISNLRGQTGEEIHSKVTSNIDSIYGFYKKKGEEDDDEDSANANIQEIEHSRNTMDFENSVGIGNYVPAN